MYGITVSCAETTGDFNTGSDTFNLHHLTVSLPLLPEAKRAAKSTVPSSPMLSRSRARTDSGGTVP
jgi:hypothetical protein